MKSPRAPHFSIPFFPGYQTDRNKLKQTQKRHLSPVLSLVFSVTEQIFPRKVKRIKKILKLLQIVPNILRAQTQKNIKEIF